MQDEPNVELALVNSPVQTVISGMKENVEKVLKKAKKENVVGMNLNISWLAHSSLLQPASVPISKLLKEMKVSKASVPILSNYTAEPYEDPKDLR